MNCSEENNTDKTVPEEFLKFTATACLSNLNVVSVDNSFITSLLNYNLNIFKVNFGNVKFIVRTVRSEES